MNKIKKFLLGIAVVANLFLPHGCNCSGKGSDTTGSTTDSTTQAAVKTISFQTSGVPVDNSVYIEAISSDADKITLAVKVKGGIDVYSAVLEVDYDGNKVSFDTCSVEGNYLKVDAGDCKIKLYRKGVLLIEVGKTGDVHGVDGDGLLLTLNFKALTTQSNAPIVFDTTNSVLYNSIKPPNGIISDTGWLGGSLSYE